MIRLFTSCLLIFMLQSTFLSAQKSAILNGVLTTVSGEPINEVIVFGENQYVATNDEGVFTLKLNINKKYKLSFQSLNIIPFKQEVFITSDTSIMFIGEKKSVDLNEVSIKANSDPFGVRKLRPTENGGLYEGKKTEVINLKKLIGNKATNNPRQAFAKIPGLNIWESDNGGLQLDIGGRGLSPKRTSNFNTRQNGYDISADALGYPESYYTPPMQAVEQIEIVRGAGALQYGSQFGGLVNFKMREGDKKKKFNFEAENTIGTYQFINSFNSFHGQVNKLNYYSYVQYKEGDGWRDNSSFKQYGAFTGLSYQASKKLKIDLDYTYMKYLTQQAGGLTDEVFENNPSFTNRKRNWFQVNWNLAALSFEYQPRENLKIYNRTFGLIANRTSLGLLETPDIADPLSNRDLIEGNFRNIGNETRFVLNYKGIKEDLQNTLLIGTRLYKGFTNFSQQFGSASSNADFTRVDTSFLDRRTSDFDFPNYNATVFVEKIIRFSENFSLIPGFRYEHINTQVDGFFTNQIRTNSFGDFIEEQINESSSRNRNVLLYGLGVSKKFKAKYELYANATANYRAINFTDVQIQTNTQLVDPNIKDESGYSFDLGLRRMSFQPFFVEANVFFILYNDRIGEVIDDDLRVRTNIGAAQIFGLEMYGEVDIFNLLKRETKHKVSIFLNGSVNKGVYTDINDRALVGVRSGNKLEDLPNYNIKSGVNCGFKKLKLSLQATFVGNQFSDAANTTEAFKGVFGEIPSYSVYDFSAQYQINNTFSLELSANNVLNNSYFTRRALAYPGPGIIPSDPRNLFLTIGIKL